MNINFCKYQGTGNDFVIIDNRTNFFPKENIVLIRDLCNRKFGVGADGLMLLEKSKSYDFKMVYFNADGNTGSMCGNGGRCIVAFADKLNIISKSAIFEAVGKLYQATIENNLISLKMNDVDQIEIHKNHLFLDTGSPHHVTFEKDISKIDVKEQGKKIRSGSPYFEKGSNVNFVEQINSNTFKVRTYERGVEDETLSCGTGVTAVAIASHKFGKSKDEIIHLKTRGGDLEVQFKVEEGTYKNIILRGPANFVFQGLIKY